MKEAAPAAVPRAVSHDSPIVAVDKAGLQRLREDERGAENTHTHSIHATLHQDE